MRERQPHPEKPEGSEQHPLQKGPLPEWLAHVPMAVKKPTLIPLAEGKTVPLAMLTGALKEDVGVTTLSFSIAPELAQLLAQFSENPAWKNLPTESTSVNRLEEDQWEVKVDDFSQTFTREELERRIITTLFAPEVKTPKRLSYSEMLRLINKPNF